MADKTPNSSLLGVARSVLRDELLSALPKEKKYQALMVANAMAISAREAEQGALTASSQEFTNALSSLLARGGNAQELEAALIKNLRQGAFGSDSPETLLLHKILTDENERRVKISNPRYLGS